MANFVSVLLDHFIKHKPLFCEEWDGKKERNIYMYDLKNKKLFWADNIKKRMELQLKRQKMHFQNFLLCKLTAAAADTI